MISSYDSSSIQRYTTTMNRNTSKLVEIGSRTLTTIREKYENHPKIGMDT